MGYGLRGYGFYEDSDKTYHQSFNAFGGFAFRDEPTNYQDNFTMAGLGYIPKQIKLKALYAFTVASQIQDPLRTAILNSIKLHDQQWDSLTKTEWGRNRIKSQLDLLASKIPIGNRLAFINIVNQIGATLQNIAALGVPAAYVGAKKGVVTIPKKVEELITKIPAMIVGAPTAVAEDMIKKAAPFLLGGAGIILTAVIVTSLIPKKTRRRRKKRR